MDQRTDDEVRQGVRERYARIAVEAEGCCGPGEGGPVAVDASRLGYSAADSEAVPAGADMGLGCGNPVALAGLGPGETVLDLGSGGGIDCFLAARQVGPEGRVIGVDMTPEMLTKARGIAAEHGHAGNVEFRLGEIEHLPVADQSVDVVMSNCVIDLSPDQAQVYREAFRVLRSGGRIAVSDVVASAPLPAEIANDPDLFSGCIGGAASADELRSWLTEAGFVDVRVTLHEESRQFIKDWAPGSDLETYVVSASIEARKP